MKKQGLKMKILNLNLKSIAPSLDQIQITQPEEKTMNPIPTKREKTHGSFKDTASTSQNIKSVMMSANNWERLNDSQREALEMIATKIGRILSGDPNFRDHWDDIEGYAELGGDTSKPSMPQVSLDIERALGASE